MLAVRFSVFPEQMGELLPAVGAFGAEGSDNVTGPTAFEGQEPRLTVMLLYTPEARFGITSAPLPLELNDTGVAGLPLNV